VGVRHPLSDRRFGGAVAFPAGVNGLNDLLDAQLTGNEALCQLVEGWRRLEALHPNRSQRLLQGAFAVDPLVLAGGFAAYRYQSKRIEGRALRTARKDLQ
jgi:hypothetical protein